MTTDSAQVLSLRNAWSTFAGRVAAGAGAAVALGAVLADVPLRIGCLRGALTCLGIVALARLGERGLRRAASQPPPVPAGKEPADESS